jgi:hypothetical protein
MRNWAAAAAGAEAVPAGGSHQQFDVCLHMYDVHAITTVMLAEKGVMPDECCSSSVGEDHFHGCAVRVQLVHLHLIH